MELGTVGAAPQMPVGSEGGDFMDPDKIIGYFGVTEGMRVADFGSGAGFFTILLAKKVGEGGIVTAIDILNSSLETLRAKAKIEGLSNIETIRSNLEVLGSSSLANDSQDIVLIANTLFQNPNKRLLIEEAKRVLKPGASLIIIEWQKGTGGFGPPDDLRVGLEEMKQVVLGDGFQFSNQFDSGIFHYGLMFKKI